MKQTHRVVRLPAHARTTLQRELRLKILPPALIAALEDHLTAYVNVVQFSAVDRAKWRTKHQNAVAALERALTWIVQDDEFELICGRATGLLQELLLDRLTRWKASSLPPPAAHRPTSWRSRLLLWRTLHTFDAAGVSVSSYEDGACMCGLQAVLRIAHHLDGRPSKGNLRLVKEVCRHFRQRDTWSPTSVWRHWYELAASEE